MRPVTDRLVLATPAMAGQTAASQPPTVALSVRIVDSTGRPVAGAGLGIGAAQTIVLVGEDGWARSRVVWAARLRLTARSPGYTPLDTALVLDPGDSTATATLRLRAAAAVLPDLVSTARPATIFDRKMADFRARRERGFGKFLDETDIQAMHVSRTAEVLRVAPGVRVSINPPGVPGSSVRFARCPQATKVGVWIDGFKQPIGSDTLGFDAWEKANRLQALTGELLDRVAPQQIAGIEIYVGTAQIPAEFRDDSCAAIVVWTK